MQTSLQLPVREVEIKVNAGAITVLERIMGDFQKGRGTSVQMISSFKERIKMIRNGELGFCPKCGVRIPGDVFFRMPLSARCCGGMECVKKPV